MAKLQQPDCHLYDIVLLKFLGNCIINCKYSSVNVGNILIPLKSKTIRQTSIYTVTQAVIKLILAVMKCIIGYSVAIQVPCCCDHCGTSVMHKWMRSCPLFPAWLFPAIADIIYCVVLERNHNKLLFFVYLSYKMF